MAASGLPKPEMRVGRVRPQPRVPLHVRSSFTWEPGTWVDEEEPTMEQAIISAVTHDISEAKVTVTGVPDRPGIAARLFRALADQHVNVDMIVQNVSIDGTPTSPSPCPRTTSSRGLEVCRVASPPRSAPPGSPPTATSPRCRSSAPA